MKTHPIPSPPRPEAEQVRYGPFRRTPTGHLEATEEAYERTGELARRASTLKHILVGHPLASAQLVHERISKAKALAVLASDALSSVAYATEEILKVLVLAGAAALTLSVPIALAIVLLLAIVAFSYRQTIYKYPQGGGTYVVTKDNLGNVPALIAGSALMVDYTLTVAVSIAAGVAAVTSAVPALAPFTLETALLAIAVITVVNLRGVREAASIFAIPTYAFIVSIFVVIGIGLWRAVTGQPPVEPVAGVVPPAVESISLFLVLRAFASGCSAMTGTEAISDGVTAFKAPQPKNAVATLMIMAGTLGAMFLGITLLAQHFGILPRPDETVVSQLVRAVAGRGWFYYVVQAATALILVLAANTSFSDFPRLGYFMARDNYLPRQFVFRGDRLAFSTGIIALGLLAGLITLVFGASMDHLIPLYAVGVFISFTFSQASMTYRWWTRREPGWRTGMVINGVGACTTAVVSLVIIVTKFTHGAWMILLLLPLMIGMLRAICGHYTSVAEQLELGPHELQPYPLRTPYTLVPIARLNKATARTLRYALALPGKVIAVHVTDDPESGEAFRREWERLHLDVDLVLLVSPYRTLVSPMLAYIDTLRHECGDSSLTVLLSEFVPRRWWEYLLHNQDAWRLKLALFFVPGVVVTDVPYHLGACE